VWSSLRSTTTKPNVRAHQMQINLATQPTILERSGAARLLYSLAIADRGAKDGKLVPNCRGLAQQSRPRTSRSFKIRSGKLNWLQEDSLIITPGDRGDIIVGMLQAHQSTNYPNLAGILLSTGLKPEPSIAKLIEGLPQTLPILSVKTDTYTTVSQIREVRSTLKSDDSEKIALSIRTFERHVDLARLETQLSLVQAQEPTPRLFNYNLIQQEKANPQHIVLPESTEPRILKAVSILRSQHIVNITLLGQRAEIERAIEQHGIQLDLNDLAIVNPATSDKIEAYASTFYTLRKHKGATLDISHDYMLDATYYGMMMVYLGDADGLVAGAIHTTQHTILPALQLIKAKPGFSLVSSVFLMYLGDRVRVYGDCAVNPNPDAAQLAEIALASADTARSRSARSSRVSKSQ
jgi:phosphate acetyltransferase